MSLVLFVDPGTTESGYALWETSDGTHGLLKIAKVKNEGLMRIVRYGTSPDDDHPAGLLPKRLVIEEIRGYGMPVGQEVFDTVRYCGRLEEAFYGPVEFIPRRDVKLSLCGSSKAKDANIRLAVLDTMGPKPTKKSPNPKWPSKPAADMWSAVALGLTWIRREWEGE